MQKPSLGRIVLAVGGKAVANGTDTASATITRVWSDKDGVWLVNATVQPDCAEQRFAPSTYLYEDEAAARASLSHPEMTALYWPPRV